MTSLSGHGTPVQSILDDLQRVCRAKNHPQASACPSARDPYRKGAPPPMDRHVPQHGLPDAIRSMRKEETVCSYCGVSYLIHNEMKALEEKAARLESELERFRDAAMREEETSERLRRSEIELATAKSKREEDVAQWKDR